MKSLRTETDIRAHELRIRTSGYCPSKLGGLSHIVFYSVKKKFTKKPCVTLKRGFQ